MVNIYLLLLHCKQDLSCKSTLCLDRNVCLRSIRTALSRAHPSWPFAGEHVLWVQLLLCCKELVIVWILTLHIEECQVPILGPVWPSPILKESWFNLGVEASSARWQSISATTESLWIDLDMALKPWCNVSETQSTYQPHKSFLALDPLIFARLGWIQDSVIPWVPNTLTISCGWI